MAGVVVRDVEKAFGSTKVIHGINIDIADGEFVVLVGHLDRDPMVTAVVP